MARWQFSPPMWASVAVTLAMAGMLWAGYWQHGRGVAKKALIAHMLDAEVAPAQPVTRLDPAAPQLPRKVALRGTYDAARQLLQDNQALDGQPGWHAWTPLRTDAGQLVVVDRGWLPQHADRTLRPELPVPDGAVEVTGFWRTLPQAGLRLSAETCATGAFPRVVQYPQAAALACTLGEPVADGLLLLDPQAGGGFARRWQVTPGMPPEKHYAYALQWFAMALVLGVLFFKVNLRRSP